jgi:hypothetical protein
MDDEGPDPWGGPGTAGEWAIVCAIVVLTAVILLPPGWYALVHASDSPITGWPTIHAQHDAAVKAAALMITFPVGGAALGALATLLLHRPVSWAGRATVMAAGACVASLALTLGGLMTVIGQLPRFLLIFNSWCLFRNSWCLFRLA